MSSVRKCEAAEEKKRRRQQKAELGDNFQGFTVVLRSCIICRRSSLDLKMEFIVFHLLV
jgi:hypothetical protein